MAFVPSHIRKIIDSKLNSHNIEILSELCGNVAAEIFWTPDFTPNRKFGVYISHLSMIIANLYLIFAHGLNMKTDCGNKSLPKINIKLYYLDYPKKFKLGESFPEVNGGYTQFPTIDSEFQIVVFRVEEMERVIAHELVHVFGYDRSDDKHDKLSPPYSSCGESSININEAITDFMAVIITSRNSSHLNFTHERIWSYIQAARVTKIYGFNSVREIFTSKKCLSEKTSVIAYYVLKSALLHTYRYRIYRKTLNGGKDTRAVVKEKIESARMIAKKTIDKIAENDDNSIIRVVKFINKFRQNKKNPKYNFQNLINTAITDEKWITTVDKQLTHPKLFTDNTASARMSISDAVTPSDVARQNFYTQKIYEI